MKRPRGDPKEEDPSADAEGEAIWQGFSQMAQRMAFYAGAWKRGRFTIPLEEARDYGKFIPAEIEREHLRIEGGAMPRLLTPEVVRALAAEE